MTKVDELVEWVAGQLDEVFSELSHYDCSEECGHKGRLTEWRDYLVKQILSRPDLYIKVRKTPLEGYEYYQYIPLAEALR